jgi:myo-inositol-1(or 4)-monophosphatase
MVEWLSLFLELTEDIRRRVQPLLGSPRAREVRGIGAGGDVTRAIDAVAEKTVIEALERRHVSCTLVSEECGTLPLNKGGGDYVVLDAIDGTTNALHGIPFVSASIAHASGPRLSDVDVGIVMDLVSGAVYTARRRGGAYVGDRPLRPSKIDSLQEAVVSLELTYRRDMRGLLRRLTPIMEKASKLRHLGSTALEAVYVASGALDAFIDLRNVTRAVDIAAASLIAREAGAAFVTPEGEEPDIELKATARTSFIVVGNPLLMQEILMLLNPAT